MRGSAILVSSLTQLAISTYNAVPSNALTASALTPYNNNPGPSSRPVCLNCPPPITATPVWLQTQLLHLAAWTGGTLLSVTATQVAQPAWLQSTPSRNALSTNNWQGSMQTTPSPTMQATSLASNKSSLTVPPATPCIWSKSVTIHCILPTFRRQTFPLEYLQAPITRRHLNKLTILSPHFRAHCRLPQSRLFCSNAPQRLTRNSL